MTWPALAEQTAADTLAVFGEPVTLPDGAVVLGVFDPQGFPPASLGSEVGLQARLSQVPNPWLQILSTDAGALRDGDRVGVRGQEYVIARMDPDGAGLTRCALRLAELASADQAERWR